MQIEDVKPLAVGIVGCGVISRAYLEAMRNFPILAPRLVADLNPEAAVQCADEFGLKAVRVAELMDDPEIEIILNLTIPVAHVEVGLQAIAAGKHVYGEKPIGINTREAKALLDAANDAGLRIGSAPDTFLGAGHQTSRLLIDSGAIGTPVAATAFMMVPGHERWHPNPSFYYAKAGGGPLLDMGPYYITDLVQLLGPVARVLAFGGVFRDQRQIATGPKAGQPIHVECLTHIAGTLEFGNGAIVQLTTSFEVFKHRHQPIEIYGNAGSLLVPDPNNFGGVVELAEMDRKWQPIKSKHNYGEGNFRSLGLADMASAIRESRPHRANGELAFHVLEVMEGLVASANGQGLVSIESSIERPLPLLAGETVGQLKGNLRNIGKTGETP